MFKKSTFSIALVLSGFLSLPSFGQQWNFNSINAYYNTGNVGIGTNNPKVKLDVGSYLNGGNLGVVLGRLQEGDVTNDGTYLGVRGIDTQPANCKSFALEHGFYGRINSSINFYRGGSINGGYITINTNDNTEKLRIDAIGNVGIGTTSPSEKLSVNGYIKAKKVIVTQNGWADNVFDSTYHLSNLKEVEQYIQANKHLPNIPSEKEIVEKGLDAGEMLKLQMAKIEELTLHLIQQQKEIDALKAKLK